MKYISVMILFSLSILKADISSYQLEELVGWTIVEVKTIEGFKEPNQPKQDGFEGCNGDTVVYFTDGTAAKCISLGLQLELMPKAIIFGMQTTYKGKKMIMYKMIVKNNTYDIYF
ncbi:hypothetical protein ACKGJI_08500 [Sulfurospirillum sp. 1307]